MAAFLREMSVERMLITFHEDDIELEEFLHDHGFAVLSCEDVYRVPAGDLMYNRKMDELLEKRGEPTAVFDLEDEMYYQKLEELLEKKGVPKDELKEISRKLSLVSFDKSGKAAGCLLVKEREEDLEVVFFLNGTLFFGGN